MQGVAIVQKTCSSSLSHKGAGRGARGSPLQRRAPKERLQPARVVQDLRQGAPDQGNLAGFWGRYLGGFKEHTAHRQGPSIAALHPSLPEGALLTARPMGNHTMAGTRVPGAGRQMAAASARGLHAVPRAGNAGARHASSTPFTPPAGSQLSRVRRLVSLFEQGADRQGAAAAAELGAAQQVGAASMAAARAPGAGSQMGGASSRGQHTVPKAARSGSVRDLVAKFDKASAGVKAEAVASLPTVEVQPPATRQEAVAGRSPGGELPSPGSRQQAQDSIGSYLASRGPEAVGLAVLGIFAAVASALALLFKSGVVKGTGRPRSSSKRLDPVSLLLAPAAPLMANTPEQLPKVEASLKQDKYAPCPTLVLAEVAVASQAVGTLAIGAGALVGTVLLSAYRAGTGLSRSYQPA